MTAAQASRPSRGILYLLLAAALVPRLLLLPLPNTDNDFVFQTWSRTVAVDGIHTIYDDPDAADRNRRCQYPPAYLYVLWGIGKLYRGFLSPGFENQTISYLMLLRLPTVLADFAVALLVYRTLARRATPRLALGAFAACLFSPAMILDSTIVTQIDSVQSLLGLASILLLIEERPTAASACLALGVLTKPQLVVLAPLFLAVVWRRDGWRAVARGAAAAVTVGVVLCIPFFLNGRTTQLLATLTGVVRVAPWVSLNAYNVWWLLTGGNGWQPDSALALGSLTFRQLGLALFALAAALGVRRALRDLGRESILLAAVWTTFAFFMVSTRVTERYALGVLPLLLLLVPCRRAYLGLFAVLSATLFVNLYLVFPLVRVSPWQALFLPHSNFYFYRPPQAPRLAILLPESQALLRAISLMVAGVHVVVLALLASRTARAGAATA